MNLFGFPRFFCFVLFHFFFLGNTVHVRVCPQDKNIRQHVLSYHLTFGKYLYVFLLLSNRNVNERVGTNAVRPLCVR